MRAVVAALAALVATLALVNAFTLPNGDFDPTPDPKAVVTVGKRARFTVLTNRLIRMEWSDGGQFVDSATFSMLNRRLPVPPFSVKQDESWIYIETDALRLKYSLKEGMFWKDNLFVTIKGTGYTWDMSSPSTGNLHGTIRTLDGVAGSIELQCDKQPRKDLHCTEGLISKDGWVLWDDSSTPLFTTDPWPWAKQRVNTELDWYFFGYGRDFRGAMGDFTKLSGKIPLPPRYAFGVWWSRYWAYSDEESRAIIGEYRQHSVPLDVFVIDMDWHHTFYKEAAHGDRDQAGQTVGWTGFTWDPRLFARPEDFLAYTKKLGLKSTVNIHPASGIQPHELYYPEMARAMGIDPKTFKYVPYNLQNLTFTNNFLKIIMKPLTDQGVDFYWLDWQQGEDWTTIPGVNPTIWLNHVFFTNSILWKEGQRRLLFHRWGGLGNHRYQIGFSGDTYPSWATLSFQVYFTSTAANVGYGLWSHDLGGHETACDPELYTRWVQWGVFSPIVRTHCTKSPTNERRIWAFPLRYFTAMRSAMQLRFQMVPYLYTAARRMHDSGVAFLRPMYYDYPNEEMAYLVPGQFLLGDDLLVAPVATAADAKTDLATQRTWLPPGSAWVSFGKGRLAAGGAVVEEGVALDEVPVWVRAGAILPIAAMPKDGDLLGKSSAPPSTMILRIFPGNEDHGEGAFYEDNSETDAYLTGEFAWTSVRFSRPSAPSSSFRIEVDPPKGTYVGQPTTRSFQFEVRGVWPATSVTATSGAKLSSYYCGRTLSMVVIVRDWTPATPLAIDIVFAADPRATPDLQSGISGLVFRLQRVKQLIDDQFPQVYQEDFDATLLLAEFGVRVTNFPETAQDEVRAFPASRAKAIAEVSTVPMDEKIRPQILALLQRL